MEYSMKSHENVQEILIVEDSPTQAEQLRHILEQERYRVITARDGRQALELLASHSPDILISKPYEESYLLSRIRHVFANRELRKTARAEMGINIYFGGAAERGAGQGAQRAEGAERGAGAEGAGADRFPERRNHQTQICRRPLR